jgi:PII interaction protein X
MSTENYLNHPSFGLLYRVCVLENNQELYATLYAQRMFFQVTIENLRTRFDVIPRTEVKALIDGRLRSYRREGDSHGYNRLQLVYSQMF